MEDMVRNPDELNTQEEARCCSRPRHAPRLRPGRIAAQGATLMVGNCRRAALVDRQAGFGPVRQRRDRRDLAHGHRHRLAGLRAGSQRARPDALETDLHDEGREPEPAGSETGRPGDRVVSGRSAQARTTSWWSTIPCPRASRSRPCWARPTASSRAPDGPFRFLGKLTYANLREARDDRFVAATALAGGKEFAFAYIARAVTPGDFLLPGAEARDMYRPSVAARTSARRAPSPRQLSVGRHHALLLLRRRWPAKQVG